MRVTSTLLALEGVDPKKEIKIYINSAGASAYSAVALVDVMRTMSCPLSTIAFGAVNGVCESVAPRRPLGSLAHSFSCYLLVVARDRTPTQKISKPSH